MVCRVRGCWPQMILLLLIVRRAPTIRELIVATPLSLSSPSATGLSAHAPAQRAGAQRLRALYRFLDAGSTETFRMRSRPASKKRRGTKSSRAAAEQRGL